MNDVSLPTGVRAATPDDVPTLLELVLELAEYERARHEVRATTDALHTALFGADPAAASLVAEQEGRTVGFALWYRTFSTWEGVPGMHLEDVFVRPGARGSGLGKALFLGLARVARARGLSRLEWDVLRWNTPAIGFYDSLDATPQEDWLGYRLDVAGIAALADG